MTHIGIIVDESKHDWIESLSTSRFGHQSYWQSYGLEDTVNHN